MPDTNIPPSAPKPEPAKADAVKKVVAEKGGQSSNGTLLTPAEAWAECKKRMCNVVPDLPALGLVVIFGAVGALLAYFWKLQLPTGDGHILIKIAELPLPLALGLGVAGAVAAVFLLAKTDTSKLIHCSLVALFSGMAGPYLVLKALNTVTSIEIAAPTGLLVQAAGVDSNSANEKSLELTQKKKMSGTTGGRISAEEFSPITHNAVNSLDAFNQLKNKKAPEADIVLKKVTGRLSATLKNLNTLAQDNSPDAVLAIKTIGDAAKQAGASELFTEAQTILVANKDNLTKAQESLNAPYLYFITPSELGDAELGQMRGQIQEWHNDWKIKPAEHPKKIDEKELEVVYYNRTLADDKVNQKSAMELSGYLKKYFEGLGATLTQEITVRSEAQNDGEARTQFDIHIGGKMATVILDSQKPKIGSTPTPTPLPAPIKLPKK